MSFEIERLFFDEEYYRSEAALDISLSSEEVFSHYQSSKSLCTYENRDECTYPNKFFKNLINQNKAKYLFINNDDDIQEYILNSESEASYKNALNLFLRSKDSLICKNFLAADEKTIESILVQSDSYNSYILLLAFLDKESYPPSPDVEDFLINTFVDVSDKFSKVNLLKFYKILEVYNVCGDKKPIEYVASLLSKFVLDNTKNVNGIIHIIKSLSEYSEEFKLNFLDQLKQRVSIGMEYNQEIFKYLDRVIFPSGKRCFIENTNDVSVEKTVSETLLMAEEQGKFKSRRHMRECYELLLLNGDNPVSKESTLGVLTELLAQQLKNEHHNIDKSLEIITTINNLLQNGFKFDNDFSKLLMKFIKKKSESSPIAFKLIDTIKENLHLLEYDKSSIKHLSKSIGKSQYTKQALRNEHFFETYIKVADFVVNHELNNKPRKILRKLDHICHKFNNNQKRLFEDLAIKANFKSKCLSRDSSYKDFPETEVSGSGCSFTLEQNKYSFNYEKGRFCENESWSDEEKDTLLYYINKLNDSKDDSSIVDASENLLRFINNYQVQPQQHNEHGDRVIDILSAKNNSSSNLLQNIKSVYLNNIQTEILPVNQFKEQVLLLNEGKDKSIFGDEEISQLDGLIELIGKVHLEYQEILKILNVKNIKYDDSTTPRKNEILFHYDNSYFSFKYFSGKKIHEVKLQLPSLGEVSNALHFSEDLPEKIIQLRESGFKFSFLLHQLNDLKTLPHNTIVVGYNLGKLNFIFNENNKIKIESGESVSQLTTEIISQHIYSHKIGLEIQNEDFSLDANQKKFLLNLFKKAFFRKYKDNPEYMSEDETHPEKIIAHCAMAAHETLFDKKYTIRDIQLFSVISLVTSHSGKILQVSTGEGKTVIVAIKTAFDALQGKNKDIVSSSRQLVIRDAEKNKPFFNLLGLTVDHVEVHDIDKIKAKYQNQILYGTISTMSAHILREEDVPDIRNYRSLDAVDIDEIDSEVVDNIRLVTLLSTNIPGFNDLIPALFQTVLITSRIFQDTTFENGVYSVNYIDESNSTIPHDYFEAKEIKNRVIGNNTEYKQYIIQQASKELERALVKQGVHIKGTHDYSDKRTLVSPNYLRDIIISDFIKPWINSIFLSIRNNEGEDYVIKKSQELAQHLIKIYSKHNGAIHDNLNWGNGLHQIIAAKHGLAPTSLSPVSNFISSLKYLQKYNEVFGLTGTIGDFHDQFYYDVLGVKTMKVPTFINKNLVIYDSQILKSQDSYYSSLAQSVERETREGRPVLLILNDYLSCEDAEKELRQTLNNVNIKYYYDSNNEEHLETVLNKVLPGDVIIASNLGGRGTDLKLAEESIKNGGLHVIFGYYPDSSRKLWQGFGRAARNGEPGSAELIAFPKDFNLFDEASLKEASDQRELEFMQQMKEVYTREVLYKDSFQDKRQELTKKIINTGKYDYLESFSGEPHDELVNTDEVYIYINDFNQIELKVRDSSDSIKRFNITGILEENFSEELRHIRAIFKSGLKDNTVHLGRGELNLITFILSRYFGIADDIQTVNRVDSHYYKKIKDFSGPQLSSSKLSEIKDLLRGTEYSFSDSELLFFMHRLELFDKDINADDIKSFDSERTKILFDLWKLDLRINSKEFLVKEIKAKFALWLNRHIEGAHSSDLEYNPLNYKDEITRAWDRFANDTLTRSGELEFFSNPSYLVQRAQNSIWRRQMYFEDIGISASEYQSQRFCEPLGFSSNTDNSYKCSGPFVNVYNNTNIKKSDYTNFYDIKPFDSAKIDLDHSIEIDKNYAAPAHQTLIVLDVIQNSYMVKYESDEVQKANGVKARVSDNLIAIKDQINHLLVRKESECIQLLVQLAYNSNLSSERYHFCLNEKLYWKKFDQNLQETIELVSDAVRDSKKVLRLKSVNDISEFMESVNGEDLAEEMKKQQSILNNTTLSNSSALSSPNITFSEILNSTLPNSTLINPREHPEFVNELRSQGYLNFQLETYELVEEDKDWIGTIVAGFVSIGMIALGIGIIAPIATSSFGVMSSVAAGAASAGTATMSTANAFAYSFGLGMATSGVVNLLSVTVNAIEGQPTDIHSFMKNAAFNIVTNVLTSGISATFAAYSTTAANLMLKDAATFSSFKAFTTGVAQFGIGKAAQYLSNEYYEKNQGNFEEDAKKLVREVLITHEDEIKKLLIEDEFNNKSDFLNKLANFVYSRFNAHSSKYHTNIANLAKSGVGSIFGETARFALGGAGSIYSAPMLNFVGGSFVNLATGLHEATNVAQKATRDLGHEITRLSGSTTSKLDMMKRSFRDHIGDPFLSEHYFKAAVSSNPGFFYSPTPFYENCKMIQEPSFIIESDARREDLYNSCEYVSKIVLNAEETYKNNFDYLLTVISGGISGQLGAVWRDQVVSSIVGFSVAQGINPITSHIIDEYGPENIKQLKNELNKPSTVKSAFIEDKQKELEQRTRDILINSRPDILKYESARASVLMQGKLAVGSDYGDIFKDMPVRAASKIGVGSESTKFRHVSSLSEASSTESVNAINAGCSESQKPVIDPVARQITASLSSEQARDLLANPIKKSAYAIAYSDLRSKGLEVNAGDLYSSINKAYIADKSWLGKAWDWLPSAFFGTAHADPAPDKLDTASLKLAHSVADKAVQANIDKITGYTAFKQKVLDQELVILAQDPYFNPSDKALDSYIRAKHQMLLDNKKWPKMSMIGLQMHAAGYSVNSFEANNPMISSGIKGAANWAGKVVDYGISAGKSLFDAWLVFGGDEVFSTEDTGISYVDRVKDRKIVLANIKKDISTTISKYATPLLEEIMDGSTREQLKFIDALEGAGDLALVAGLSKAATKPLVKGVKNSALKIKPSLSTGIDDLVDTTLKATDDVAKVDMSAKYFATEVNIAKYGEIAKLLSADAEILAANAKWGIVNGESQLLKHSLGMNNLPQRIAGLESRAGLPKGSLTDVFADDIVKVKASLKKFNDLSNNIIGSYTEHAILENGVKEVFWKKSVYNAKDGIGVIRYNGKVQSMMNMNLKEFKRSFNK